MKFQEPIWKGFSVDSARLSSNERTYHFFNEGNDQYSILDLDENQIVSAICSNPNHLNLLLDTAGIIAYSAIIKNIERKAIFDAGGGDLDLIVYGPDYPFKIACFEFKRVKITAVDFEEDKINKISGIETLLNQLEERVKLGFYATFGVIILHSDLRKRRTPNTILRNYSQETYERLSYEILKDGKLPKESGLLLLKYDQPTGKRYALNFFVSLFKPCEFMKQKDRIYDRFHDYLNRNLNLIHID
ncbi:hypothetical protein [Leptospira santarosai]|uniref:hypothetical protein n=1 Tax=Leptospira santarosai TaxID=28183 RepID=UPI0002BD506F|nr:hypothetical protein [Leptospira santarosai]EMJ48714.1 hypothetical protein LEP1GSC169_3013 [Leptospira santarosai str. HAI1349]